MYKEGHVGLTLLLFSPFYYIFNLWDLRHVTMLFIALAFSTVPDYDLKVQRLGLRSTFKFFAVIFLIVSALLYLIHRTYVAVASLLTSLTLLILYGMSEHRKFSHTVFFATICGAFAGFFTLNVFGDFVIGFLGAFSGVLSHITGDLLTYTPFSPFYPLVKRKVSLKLFRSSNVLVNRSILLAGLVVFASTYQGGTVLRYVSDFLR